MASQEVWTSLPEAEYIVGFKLKAILAVSFFFFFNENQFTVQLPSLLNGVIHCRHLNMCTVHYCRHIVGSGEKKGLFLEKLPGNLILHRESGSPLVAFKETQLQASSRGEVLPSSREISAGKTPAAQTNERV